MLPTPNPLSGLHGWRVVGSHLFQHLGHQSLTEDEQSVLDELDERGRADPGTLAAATGLPEPAVRSALEGLRQTRIVETVRADGDRYELTAFHARLLRMWKRHVPLDRLKRSLLTGMSQYVSLQLLSLGLGYVTQIVLARWLGTEDFGFVSLAVTLAVVLSNVASFGFPTGVERFLPEYAEDRSWDAFRGLLRRGVQIPAAAGVVMAGMGAPIVFLGTSLPQEEKLAFTLGLLLVPLLAVSGLLSGVLQSLRKVVAAYLPDDVMAPVLVGVGVLAMGTALGDISALHVLAWMLAVHSIMLGAQAAWVRRALPDGYGSAEPRYKTKQWLGTTGPIMVMTLFGIVIYRADLLLVGHLLGRAEAGIYAVVLSTSEFLQMFLKGGRSVAGPYIAPFLRRGDRKSFQRLMTMVARYAFLPTLVGAVACALFGHRILDLFGSGFDRGYWPLVVMLGAQLVKAATGGPAIALLFSGHQARVAQVYAVTVVLDLALLFLLIPRMGMLGASLASLATVTVSQLALMVLADRDAGVVSSILGRKVVEEVI